MCYSEIWQDCAATAWAVHPSYFMLLWSSLFDLNAQKVTVGNSEKVTFRSTVRENKIKTTDKIQQRDHSSFPSRQVGKPVQNYKNRQRKNQLSKQRTYGPETPLHHLPPFAIEMAELGVNPSFEQRLESSSSHREYLKQDIPGELSLFTYKKKAYVPAFGCSHLKPNYLVSIQMEHLTKYNCQSQIRNNLCDNYSHLRSWLTVNRYWL